jgi:hypothetical protein
METGLPWRVLFNPLCEDPDVRHTQGPHAANGDVTAAIQERGYAVLASAVPERAVQAALRHLHLDLVHRGLPAETLGSWLWSTDWFPHLKWDPPVVELASYLPGDLRDGEMCDPQIVLQPPDDGEHEIAPHVDELPEWADGRGYIRIVGVALSSATADDGGLLIWPFDGHGPEPLELDPGDVVVMHPQLPHSSGVNRGGAIRYAVYFRFLEPAA